MVIMMLAMWFFSIDICVLNELVIFLNAISEAPADLFANLSTFVCSVVKF